MNDQRIVYFRKALQALLESLDATARILALGQHGERP